MSWLSVCTVGLLGALIGSFGNVLCDRLPQGRSLGGRSHCDGCGKRLTAMDLIPVFGALLQRHKARCCRAVIAWQYTAWELCTGLLFVAATTVSTTVPQALAVGICFALLLWIARIDIRTQMIPDTLNASLLIVATTAMLLRGMVSTGAVIIMVTALGGQWLLSRGKWIGSGDVLLGIGIGVLVGGIREALIVLFLAYVIGGAVAAWLLLSRRVTPQSHIAFGPFLCGSAIATVLCARWIFIAIGWA